MLSMSRWTDLIVFDEQENRSYGIDFQSIGQMFYTFISNFIVFTIQRDQRLFSSKKKWNKITERTMCLLPNCFAEHLQELSLRVDLFYSIEEEELSMSIE